MEMDSVHLDDNVEGTEDKSAELLLSSCSPNMPDIFGVPRVLPRVGDQYQAEIPPLILRHDRLQLINKSTDLKVMVDQPNSFLLELPIPIMWANDVENINGMVKIEISKESQITSNNADTEPKVEPLDSVLGDKQDAGGFSKLQPAVGSHKMDVDLVQDSKDLVEKGLCPLPGILDEPWRDIDRDGFILGLYIFGKDLNVVKRFVESKNMGDILSFYYGKFYRSEGHRRWSECRKLKSRRAIHGQKIFAGGRQQELLSRLFFKVSEESQNILLEVSRTYGEGKFSLKEYVFTLKDTVGLNMLVEAIGIGKGKQDITGIVTEPTKTNNVLSVRPEVPIGKACSSLTSAEIIKFLTGDFRLSKARSSDLFWEAVWPRLLARGWHSEQPKDHGISGSKHSLVFLIPGVKKFSRRRLVKGDHYFDSVSDVLNKVASDPGLIELETEAATGSAHKEEYKWDPLIIQDPDGLSKKQRHCYLQPRKSNGNKDVMKFTVVDTSLVRGEERSKVRELRSLPVEITSVSNPSSLSNETEEDSSEESEAEESNTSNAVEDMPDKGTCADSSDCITSILKSRMLNAPDTIIEVVKNSECQSTSLPNDKRPRKTMKYQFRRKLKSGNSNYLIPLTKQACGLGESSHSIENISADSKLNEDESHCLSNSPDACEGMVFQVGPSQNLSSASSLAKGSPEGSNEVTIRENCIGRELSPEKTQSQTVIDLNLPCVSPELGTDEPFVVTMLQNNNDSCGNKPSFLPEKPEPLKLHDGGATTERQGSMNSRRQSTRNRPLTTKALEALECGFFNPKRKRKGPESPQNDSMLRSSRRVHSRTDVGETYGNGSGNDIADSRVEEESLEGVLSSNTNVVPESQI